MHLHTSINPQILTHEPDRVATRDGYGETLRALGDEYPNIVALSADLVGSTRTKAFADAYPDRFVQCGIAEQNMASVASGMAALGKIPFIASYAMFSPGRSWEQVRTTIAYNNQNVKIMGAHAGISVGPDGATHQAIEDIALMRVIPNMTVLVPCDTHEVARAVRAAAAHTGPVYIRLGREATPVITSEDTPFEIGKSVWLARKESDMQTVGIVTTGTLAHTALRVADTLEREQGCAVSVLHMPSIKPLDTEALAELATDHERIITIEEHQRAGGLGGAVAECVSERTPRPILRIGIDDTFGQSGTPEELLAHYGLDAASIVERVTTFVHN